MSKPDFECHVTVASVISPILDDLADALGWSTSTIDGDPLLGSGSRFYFTTHEPRIATMRTRMAELVRELDAHGVPVIRRKIEAVVFDSRDERRAL